VVVYWIELKRGLSAMRQAPRLSKGLAGTKDEASMKLCVVGVSHSLFVRTRVEEGCYIDVRLHVSVD